MTYLKAVLAIMVGFATLLFDSPTNAQGSPPRLYTSRTFQVMTDLPPEKSKELMGKLETMMKLVSAYYGRPCRKPIRMYVVDNIANWPKEELDRFSPAGLSKIQEGAGITETRTTSIVGGPKIDADVIVYAVSSHGIAQHEAVHAYCGVTFGETGPVWYSEGMAEVGHYFRDGDKGVNALPEVIDYLKSQSPKPLMEVVNNPLETTGDSWQNYASRWVVCHLLGSNSNYAPRFKPLGLALLAGSDISFQDVYGTQIPEIEFEYKLFLQDMESGYRNDLCCWDWKAKYKNVVGNYQGTCKVEAGRGWQAARVNLKAGQTYQITATGEWTLGKGESPVTVAGAEDGRGALMGIIFQDYSLSEPFEIGGSETFTAPQDGKLYLRCGDSWGAIADNKGSVLVKIGLATP